MYSEGVMDLMEMIMLLPFATDLKAKLDAIETKAKERYLPVFEKVSLFTAHIKVCGLITDTFCLQSIEDPFIND